MCLWMDALITIFVMYSWAVEIFRLEKKAGLPMIKGRISALSLQAKTTTILSLTRYDVCATKI